MTLKHTFFTYFPASCNSIYKQPDAMKSWEGLHRFCFRFIFVPFSGILFWGGQDNTALSWIQDDVCIVRWGTALNPLSDMNSIHSTWYSAVKNPLEASPFTWGSRSAFLRRCAGTEELPNTGSWASLSPAASATSAWCSSVSISEFNGEFQLLAIPGMDLPLSLLLQLGCF